MAKSDFENDGRLKLLIAVDQDGNPMWAEKADGTRTTIDTPSQMPPPKDDKYFRSGPINNINLLKINELSIFTYQQLDDTGQPKLDSSGQPETLIRCHFWCWYC